MLALTSTEETLSRQHRTEMPNNDRRRGERKENREVSLESSPSALALLPVDVMSGTNPSFVNSKIAGVLFYLSNAPAGCFVPEQIIPAIH